MGGLDYAYASPPARLMDFAYRVLISGGRVKHDPRFIRGDLADHCPIEVPLEDEFVFICRHVGQRSAYFAGLWLSLALKSPQRVKRAFEIARQRTTKFSQPRPDEGIKNQLRLMSQTKRQRVRSISAIIPTLNRYDYLSKSIDSLLAQSPSINEIIVVDQTPTSERNKEVYKKYENHNIRVIFLDRAGQSSARNVAIHAASSEWCLLFEDDATAWRDLLAEHVKVLEYSGAQASTGISLAPWKTVDHIPPEIRHYHLADVLATGNCLVNKDALLDVGGLDHAFDHGSGADNDLGTRLYLNGYEIVFNPKAIETHFKAYTGGMRMYGAWWRDQTTFWAPYPPPTQIYALRRFYPPKYWLPLFARFYLNAYKRNNPVQTTWLWLAAPYKITRALCLAKSLHTFLGLLPENISRSIGSLAEDLEDLNKASFV
jgi:GT2 family glycosyltransferase